MKSMIQRMLIATCLAALPECGPVALARPEAIPEQEISSLRKELASPGGHRDSPIRLRRTYKNVARKAQALLEAAPEAPNRFAVLGIIFQSRKRLLALENTETNREAVFAACEQLSRAPDEYAEDRLEADLLLSERALSNRNATLAERAKALEDLVERYRDTEAEAKSLRMAALIVQKLDAPELENAILYAMDERFPDDHEVIAFRRKHLRISRLDVSFSGEFARVDGPVLRFPMDTAGHLCLLVFWSKNTPAIETFLEQVHAHETNHPGRLDVFSFNVDELPDGGEATLRELGLDWNVMRLPGGKNHPAYRTYPQDDPAAILINAYGKAVLRPGLGSDAVGFRSEQKSIFKIDDARFSEERYLAQLQSLFIGDFLAGSVESGEESTSPSQIAPELKAIQSCFVAPPFRYRLSREEALAKYRAAEALCAEALGKYPQAPERPLLQNRRIIALLGLWNQAGQPKYLEQAVQGAEAALASKPPPGAEVVPRFCLAKEALRRGEAEAASVVSAFLEACGGPDAPAAAVAAAAVLALDAGSRELHETYRSLFLSKHEEHPAYYAVGSFLRDRHHRFRLLEPNHIGRERGTRIYIVNHGLEPMTNRLPRIELRKTDGRLLSLPREQSDTLTLLVFVEPPADPGADFPAIPDRHGKPTRNDFLRRVMDDAQRLANEHIHKQVEVITAFLSDNASHVDFLMKTNGWAGQAAMVPGGLANPLVQRLGILSADRLPNIFLLRRDGTVAWQASGLPYKAEFGFPFAFLLGMKVQIELCEVEHAYQALEQGRFEEAARVFSGPYLPWNPDRFGWRSPRYHGKALARMGLKDWAGALDAIDTAIDDHKLRHFHGYGRRRKHAIHWRLDAERVTIKQPCDVMVELWATKAAILDQLGRKEEAAGERKRAEEPVKPDPPDLYKAFHKKLEQWQRTTGQDTWRK
jgi:hypothetical protein